jgi:uncharacterized protein YfaS (alpha-2-macroglobulin family)
LGSPLRDQAVMLDALSWVGEKKVAEPMMRAVASELSDPGHFHHTQSLGFALMALGRYAGKLTEPGEKIRYHIEMGGQKKSGGFTQLMIQIPLSESEMTRIESGQSSLKVTQEGSGRLFARIQITGIPPLKATPSQAQGLSMETNFFDGAGREIDPHSLTQGNDLVVQDRVRRKDSQKYKMENFALSALFPAGWEIRNTRLDPTGEAGAALTASQTGSWAGWNSSRSSLLFEYQDIRDDRVNTYFALGPNEEKTFRFHVQAAYLGEFHLPATVFEAMYKPEWRAESKAFKVAVIPAGSNDSQK